MRRRLGRIWRIGRTDAPAPLYLLACLLLGGATREGLVFHALLEIAGFVILATLWLRPGGAPLSATARRLRTLVVIGVAIMLVELVPLPPALWRLLPGRDGIAQGFTLVGAAPGWLPISLTPDASLWTLASLLPAMAIAAMALTGSRRSVDGMLLVVVGVAVISIGLGFLQLSGSFYFYEITNHGQPVGFFANSNHLATLLATAFPLMAALAARVASGRSGQRVIATRMILACVGLLIVVALLFNGARAAFILLVPALVGAALLLRMDRNTALPRRWAWVGVAMSAGVAATLVAAAMTNALVPADLAARNTSRGTILLTSAQAARQYFPIGSGLGSFVTVYPQFENPDAVTRVFINHAHDDYLEIVVELGIVGIALILALLAWWVRRFVAIWANGGPGTLMARAGTIGALVVLLHETVDYPARTIAIMSVFALCLALMAKPALLPPTREEKSRRKSSRHRSV